MSKSASNPKDKGGRRERKVAKDLSLWLSCGENDSIFWRSSLSGGRATIGAKEGNLRKTQSGDLSAIHSLGEPFLETFYVELKHYKNLNIESFLLTNKGNLAKFWHETETESKKYDKHPLLIAKQNHRPTLIITDYYGYMELDVNADVFPLQIGECDVYVGFYDIFLEVCDPSQFWPENHIWEEVNNE